MIKSDYSSDFTDGEKPGSVRDASYCVRKVPTDLLLPDIPGDLEAKFDKLVHQKLGEIAASLSDLSFQPDA